MTKERWSEIVRDLLARWHRDKNDWREQGDHEIGSMIRDGIGDVEWLLRDVSLDDHDATVIRSAIERLRHQGAELRSRLSDDQDEWTAPILSDVIEKLEAMLSDGPPASGGHDG